MNMHTFYRVSRSLLRSALLTAILAVAIFLQNAETAQAVGDCSLATGKPYRTQESATVFLVTPECTKRPFVNPNRFFSFFETWSSVTFVDKAVLNAIPDDGTGFLPLGPRVDLETGSLVKLQTKSDVYLISEKKANPIANEQVFTSLGMSSQEVEEVANETLAKYQIQTNLIKTLADLPESSVFKYANNPEVYILKKEGEQVLKAHVASMDVLSVLARPDRILVLPSDITYSDTTPVTEDSVVALRNEKRTRGIVSTEELSTTPIIPEVSDSPIVPVISDSPVVPVIPDSPIVPVITETATEPASPSVAIETPTNAQTADVMPPFIRSFALPSVGTSSRRVPISLDAEDDRSIFRYFFSESPTAPTSTTRGWTFATSTYTFPNALGTKTLYSWVKDEAGNISHHASSTIVFPSPVLDTTSPFIRSFGIPNTWTGRRVPITLDAFDDTEIYRYFFSESPIKPASSTRGWTFATSTYTFPDAYGWRWLYVWVKDKAGHISHCASSTIHFPPRPGADRIAPIVSSFTLPTESTSLEVQITSLTATDDRGVVSGYLVKESSTTPQSTSTAWLSTAPTSYTFADAEGTKTLYAWAKDFAGNVSAYMSASTTITLPDITAPVVTSFTIPSTATSLEIPITSFVATDDREVSAYLVSESSTTPSVDSDYWLPTAPTNHVFADEVGTKTLYAWVKDSTGNISSVVSAETTITLPDITAPVITSFTIPSAVTTLEVAITSFTATDDEGVTGYMVSESDAVPAADSTAWLSTAPTSYTFADAEGMKTLYAWAKDSNGNISSSAYAQTIITLPPVIDVTAPVITSFTLPSTGTSRVVPILSLETTDDVGVVAYFYKINSIAPTSTTAGWVSSPTSTYTFANASGTKTLYVWVKDVAGNVSSVASASVVLSSPAPVISLIGSTISSSSSTSVTVSWTTNLPSTSGIVYGLSTKYGVTTASNVLSTSHALDLTNLLATSTAYHYRVFSRTDEWVNATSTDQTFQLNF
jgi:hypothetical protein